MRRVYKPETNLFSLKENFRLACTDSGKFKFLMEMSKAQRQKTQIHNLHLIEGMTFTDDEYGFPMLSPYNGPTDLIYVPYSSRNRVEITDKTAIMFFEDDYKFYRATWDCLDVTTYRLLPFKTLLTPDHSLYVDLPDAYNIEMIYKTRFAGAFWTNCGFERIPTASWGNAGSFRYCFRGLPQYSVIAVCGLGIDWCIGARELWNMGMREMEAQLSPTHIIVYGEERDVPGVSTDITFIPPYVKSKIQNNKKR